MTSGPSVAVNNGQSLVDGPAGIALLHIQRALTGRCSWTDVHALIREAAAGPIDASDHAGLYYGAPAIAFMLHTVGDRCRIRYQQALTVLDRHVDRLTHRRLSAAARRIDADEFPRFGEYDLFYGLVGIGALLRLRRPHSDAFADVLRHLVRLVQPTDRCGTETPGWWVAHDPDPTLPTPGGHANFGMAHGAAGILALLSLAKADGRVVDGQREAIERLVDWFDRWRQTSPDGPWWPQWITRTELRNSRPNQRGPGRPSWCYGSIGILRALQLAAIATGETVRQRTAESALSETLTSRSLERLTGHGLCHGTAGVYQTAYRAARDSTDSRLSRQLPALASALAHGDAGVCVKKGLLNGRAGVELALETAQFGTPHDSGWDRCLLIS
ncbi:MAG TPA: lanthionine synthetase C family protein [Spirillospora sp.]|nr:lanthionine synthetase C family protein [Spirillospora sp.]